MCGGGGGGRGQRGLKPLLFMQNIILNSDSAPITNICVRSAEGSSTPYVKHHSETHIIRNNLMKQNKGLHGKLKNI